MHDIPLGPLSAFDERNGEVVLFDEKKVVLIQLADGIRTEYSVNVGYGANYYYWSRIHFIKSDVILCLLKSHVSRVFYFVSFKLNFFNKQCIPLHEFNSNLYSNGFRIQAHRAGSQLVYSFNNEEKRKDKIKLTKSISDRQLFARQIHQQEHSQSILPKLNDIPLGNRNIHADGRCVFESVQHNKNIREGVMVVVQCNDQGIISATVLSLGQRRFEVKLRNLSRVSHLKDTLGVKFMTRWISQNNESFCEPFLSNGNAVFLCRNNPSTCCVLPTVPNPRFGILAALEDKFREGFRIQSSTLEPLQITVYGTCPNPMHLWSNIDVVCGNGMLVTMDSTSGSCFLNILNIMPGSVPRFFWQQTQLLATFSKKNPDQLVFRVLESSQGLNITVRGTYSERDKPHCFIEQIAVMS